MTHTHSTDKPKGTGGKRRRYRKSRKPSKTRRNKTHRNKRR